MLDRYVVEELTPEELEKELELTPDTKVQFKLVETGYKPMTLGRYVTEEDAIVSKLEWVARDDLNEEIEEFIDASLDKFGSVLEADEIRAMIKEY